MLQNNVDIVFVGKVDGEWVASPRRCVARGAWLPLGHVRTAGEALAAAHCLFPESLLAVKRLVPSASPTPLAVAS
jgi:hypothetical protein